MLLDAVLQRRDEVDPVMRIILTVFTFLFGMLAHAAHLAPWDTDGDGARAGMSANGGGVVACRVSCGGVESFSCDLAGNLLSASNSVAAETFAYDGAWNLALELMASNPNFRNAGVQNAVYQAVVDEWGSPLKRLGAYGEEPIAVEPEIVDALWDLGAAATAYRNLGANEPVMKSPVNAVIGRVRDLGRVGPNEKTLLPLLPDKGSPKANWIQNSRVLRTEMQRKVPIRDAPPSDHSGAFLNAERNLLRNHGWRFDPKTSYWYPPE